VDLGQPVGRPLIGFRLQLLKGAAIVVLCNLAESFARAVVVTADGEDCALGSSA